MLKSERRIPWEGWFKAAHHADQVLPFPRFCCYTSVPPQEAETIQHSGHGFIHCRWNTTESPLLLNEHRGLTVRVVPGAEATRRHLQVSSFSVHCVTHILASHQTPAPRQRCNPILAARDPEANMCVCALTKLGLAPGTFASIHQTTCFCTDSEQILTSSDVTQGGVGAWGAWSVAKYFRRLFFPALGILKTHLPSSKGSCGSLRAGAALVETK